MSEGSMFVRPFRYANGGPNVALENFTTEALRSAIEEDPAPMLRALSRVVVPTGDGEKASAGRSVANVIDGAIGLVPDTQHYVRGVGVIDLVLGLRRPGTSAELWIEVKAGAPETVLKPGQPSGGQAAPVATTGEDLGQLARYRRYIDAHQGVERALLTLSDHRFDGTAWLPWNALWAAVQTAPAVSKIWRDLLTFRR